MRKICVATAKRRCKDLCGLYSEVTSVWQERPNNYRPAPFHLDSCLAVTARRGHGQTLRPALHKLRWECRASPSPESPLLGRKTGHSLAKCAHSGEAAFQ